MGLDRALRAPAGDRALPQPRRRQVRPAPGHPVQEPGDGGRLRRGRRRLGDHARGRPPPPLALPRHRDRPAVRPDPAADRGRRRLRGRGLPHRLLAQAAGRRSTGKRVGRDRHRRHRRAGDPGDRQDRGAPHRLPAPPELVHAAPQPADPQGGDGRDPHGLSGDIFARCQETAACFVHTTDPRGTFEVSEEERQAFWEKLYASPGFGIWHGQLPRHADRPRGERG